MKKIKAYSSDGQKVEYLVPSRDEALENIKETWGKQYDEIEKREVEGGIPQLWEKVK